MEAVGEMDVVGTSRPRRAMLGIEAMNGRVVFDGFARSESEGC